MDLPDSIGRRMKLAAARRGLSMKALVVAALEHELDANWGRTQAHNIAFPLVSSRKPGIYEMNPEQISDILVREEAVAYEASDRR
jgi:hypothetical protein